jgi:hypothetical protein
MPDRSRGISRARQRGLLRVPRTQIAQGVAVAIGLVALLPAAALAFPGEQEWVAEYDGGVLNGFELAYAVAVSADGTRVYVTGQSASSNGLNDYATVAYDAAGGAEIWVARFDAGYEDAAASVAASPNGSRVFVTGTSYRDFGSDADYATVAYHATGGQAWVRRYDGVGTDYGRAVVVSPDGSRVFVTGTSDGSGTSRDYLTIAYDAADGTTLWARRYDGPASGNGSYGDQASALALSSDGTRLYVTGGTESGAHGFDYATIAYDAVTGAKLWLRRYDGPASQWDVAYALSLNRAGTRVYVTGESDSVANNCLNCEPDYATVGYRADTGKQLWTRRFGQARAEDRAQSLAVSPKGFVVVTGESRHQYGFDYATIAYRTGTGATAWVDRYDSAHRADVPRALSVSPDGSRVYVTGESVGPNGYSDAATLAYDTATGARVWLSRYDAGSQDRAFALAVAPDGKHVFVAGHTVGDPGFEYLTVSYAG